MLVPVYVGMLEEAFSAESNLKCLEFLELQSKKPRLVLVLVQEFKPRWHCIFLPR